jgi:hypothetical protein
MDITQVTEVECNEVEGSKVLDTVFGATEQPERVPSPFNYQEAFKTILDDNQVYHELPLEIKDLSSSAFQAL